MFRTSFTHKRRHRASRIDTNRKTSMSIDTFWGFFHCLTFLIIIKLFKINQKGTILLSKINKLFTIDKKGLIDTLKNY